MKILVVEDKTDIVSSYKETIAKFVSEGNDVECVYVNDLEGAVDVIDKQRFDGAIIDLRLSPMDIDGEHGSNLVKKIINHKTFPVFIYSAHTGDWADDDIEQSSFFQVFDKININFLEIVKKNLEIFKTGITDILGENGEINKKLKDIFWKHISLSFNTLIAKGCDKIGLERYIIGHLYEYLVLDDESTMYKPEEFYITPPIKEIYFTGSIVNCINGVNSGNKYIILTPACDLANNKAKKVLLAKIVPLSSHINVSDYKIAPGRRKPEKQISNIANNAISTSLHFLPKTACFDGGFIDFQCLETYEYPGTFSSDFSVIATVNSYFLKDIISRFSSHYSRQGAPNVTMSESDI